MKKPQAREFDVNAAQKALSECPEIVRDYVALIEARYFAEKELLQKALAKIRELSA